MASARDERALEAAIMFSSSAAVGPALITQRRRQVGGRRTAGFFSALGGFVKGGLRIATKLIPGTLDDALVEAVIGRGAQRTDVSRPLSITSVATPAGCPPGFKLVNRKCVVAGVQGAVQRLIPGGRPGELTEEFGEAVLGAFDMPALVPAQVGSITRADGSVGVLLRCPRNMVLGVDDLCYKKGSIANRDRKWPKGSKPPISAADWRATKRFAAVQKKVKIVAGDAGFTTTKKGTGKKGPSKAELQALIHHEGG